MEAYSDFATVYDTFMDETPYEVWGDYVAELIDEYGISRPYTEPGSGTESAPDAEEIERCRGRYGS